MAPSSAGAPGAAAVRTVRRSARRPLAALAPLLLLAAACTPGLTPMARPVPAATPAPVRAPAATGPALADAEYLRERQLMVPVAGVVPARLEDSFSAPRDGGSRRHNAIDIMAPRGTPVLAADDGRVHRVSRNNLGGLTVYVLDLAERFLYYYAHLDGYRDGLREGMTVARGEVLGYVGTTGNAPANVPHLHFQAMRYRRGRYWDGEAVNPKPYLVLPGLTANAVTSNDTRTDPR